MTLKHFLLLLFLPCFIIFANSAPSTFFTNPTSAECVATDYCPSFCTYQVQSNNTLKPMCSAGLTVYDTGGCTACDPQFFNLTGNFCIPHLLNNEYKQQYYNFFQSISAGAYSSYRLGWYNAAIPSGSSAITASKSLPNFRNMATYTVTTPLPHYAVRIRFSIYMYRNDISSYYYPINYSMDETMYTYDPSATPYWTCNDIVTSPLQTHYGANLTVNWMNANTTNYPFNQVGCSNCDCTTPVYTCCCSGCASAGCCDTSNCWTPTCCDHKYIQINDLLVFVSKCTDNCLSCSTATNCLVCNTGYNLNLADKLCYSSCPQSTYVNSTSYFIGNYTSTGSYVQVYMSVCTSCNNTCLQCLSLTVCTRCYTTGRNESYLFYGTCINPCINGYFANMTNHTCDCPADYHFPFVNLGNTTMYCYNCAFECIRCFERTNLDCTKCEIGFYLANGTTHCLNSCPSGQFINSVTLTCYLCDITCSTCVNSSTTCTQCFTNTPRYLLGTQCLSWCPPGYSWNNITRTCDLCDSYTYSYQGKCQTTCPKMYEANFNNRTCIPYSQTNYTFSLVLESIHVMEHGKLLQYTILAQDGLNTTSENWMKRYSYLMVQVIYGDSGISNFVGVRSLQNTTLAIRNLNYSNNRITYTTNVPDTMDYHKSFQIVFLNTLFSSQDIKYNNYTNIYSINQHPELLKQYYSYSAKNKFDFILLPFLAITFFLFGLYLKGTYDMFIEVYRIVQLLGVLLFSAFPVGSYTFYFLIGCSYMNFDFVPNLYAMLAKPDTSVVFASYFMGSDDMDFIRLMGSILLFGVVSLIVYVFCRFVLNFKEARLDYMSKLCIDLMEVKIFHSFWSSLLYIVSNYLQTQFAMFMIFIFAIIFLGAIIGRRYAIWKQTKDFSPFFIWRAVSTLLVCFVAMANEIVISILVIVSLAITLWQFFLLHSNKYLININNLDSSNYMDERTFKILNNYDLQVSFSFSISFRNIIITICPFITSLIAGVLILLRDVQFYSIILSTGLIYFLLLLVMINTIFIYQFLKERRKFLVQNKLEYLQKKYTKMSANDTQYAEQRKRPRQIQVLNFDEQKYVQPGPVNRNMMKSFD